MKLGQPLVKLPRQYDAAALAAEVRALPTSAWLPHPGKMPGNDAVPLITPGGAVTDAFAGPMAATAALRACPYIMQIMADLGAVWGRSRLMGLAPQAVVAEHVDVGYYWRTHVRIHIPIITNPGVLFRCDGDTVHMAAGECWVFDSFCTHDVRNTGDAKRVHLVLDTVGGEKLWAMIAQAKAAGRDAVVRQAVPPGAAVSDAALAYERINTPEIMSVWEIRCHVDFLIGLAPAGAERDTIAARLEQFGHAWGAVWAQHGADPAALPAYQALLTAIRSDLLRLGAGRVVLGNGVPLERALEAMIFAVAAPQPTPALRIPAHAAA